MGDALRRRVDRGERGGAARRDHWPAAAAAPREDTECASGGAVRCSHSSVPAACRRVVGFVVPPDHNLRSDATDACAPRRSASRRDPRVLFLHWVAGWTVVRTMHVVEPSAVAAARSAIRHGDEDCWRTPSSCSICTSSRSRIKRDEVPDLPGQSSDTQPPPTYVAPSGVP